MCGRFQTPTLIMAKNFIPQLRYPKANCHHINRTAHKKQTVGLSLKSTATSDMNRHLKQTDAAAANLKVSIQKDSRLSEFTRSLTSITLNLNEDFPVDRRRVSLLKFPNDSCQIFTII